MKQLRKPVQRYREHIDRIEFVEDTSYRGTECLIDYLFMWEESGRTYKICQKISKVKNYKGLFSIWFSDIPERKDIDALRILFDTVLEGDELYEVYIQDERWEIRGDDTKALELMKYLEDKSYNIGGKYNEKTIEWIVRNDKKYCEWMFMNYITSDSKKLSKFRKLKEEYNKVYGNNIHIEDFEDFCDTARNKKLFKELYDPSLGSDQLCGGGIYLGDGVYLDPDGNFYCE